MSFDSLLTDKCDIYHLKTEETSQGFGLPPKKEYYYNLTPDLGSVPCSYSESNQSLGDTELSPTIVQTLKIIFRKDADVRLNDKVVFGGAVFKLQVPKSIKGHHIEVKAIRKENL